jgi:DNA-directed DNA polymerase III PolC
MFVPLHAKSHFSLGYGTASVEELVDRAAVLGYHALALTDLETMAGQVRFHVHCRRRGLRPITGVELRPGFDGRRHFGTRRGRLVLLAMDGIGYRNLCEIVSRRRGGVGRRTFAGTAGEDLAALTAGHARGLFVLSDDPLTVEQLLREGAFPRERLALLLIRPAPQALDLARRTAAARLGVRLVADLDSVFPQAEDHPLHLLQVAIHRGRRLAEAVQDGEHEDPQRWLRPPAEASALFSDLPEAVAAAEEIASACGLAVELRSDISPLVDPAAGTTLTKELRRRCDEAVSQRPPMHWSPAHARRLAEELAAVERLGFSGLLLAVADILHHCRAEAIPAVVRGSAAGSLVLHLLGGAPADPVVHGLLFERFLHPGKHDWPDVDIDLPSHCRDEVIDWVFRRFGRERVAMVAAHHGFGPRSALREGLKAQSVRPALIEILARRLPPEDLALEAVDFLDLAETPPQAASETDEVFAAADGPAGLNGMLALSQRLIGRLRHTGTHPGALLIGRSSLATLLPLERAPKGVVITQYDAAAVAALGLAKIDLLGNHCLSELQETLTLAGLPEPSRLETIPSEDARTLALIDRADTLGCFQLESPAMRSLLARLPIRNQADLVAALALIRPGAAAGAAKTAYIRRARGEEPIEIPFPEVGGRLSETHGLLLYEEDIMVLLSRIGGIGLAEADRLRAAIVDSGGDPTALAALETDFLAAAECLRPGGPARRHAQRAWQAAARFAAYSFNKAHAVSYGLLAYCSAYAKAHYPLAFGCALLNHHQGLYPLRTLAADLGRRGLVLLPPHVNSSRQASSLEGQAIRVGLNRVKSLSRRTANLLLAARAQAAFADLHDLLQRVPMNRREVHALILAGCCNGLTPLAADRYPFIHEVALHWLDHGGDPAGLAELPIPRPVGDAAQIQLYQGLVRAKNELRFLAMHLSAHPLALLRPEAERVGCVRISQAAGLSDGAALRLAVMVAAMRRVPTRQGPMLFVSLEDDTGMLEAVVLPPAYRRLGDRVVTPGPFLVEGILRCQQGAAHVEISRLAPFHRREQPFGRGP